MPLKLERRKAAQESGRFFLSRQDAANLQDLSLGGGWGFGCCDL